MIGATSNYFILVVLGTLLCFHRLASITGQEILLESTLVRCTDEKQDIPDPNPIQLATSIKGPTLNVKVYSRCKKKLLITLRVTESSKEFVTDALILINKAMNNLTQKHSQFGLPIAVKFHQEKILQKYSLKYLFRVNGKMYEEVKNADSDKNFTGCDDSPQSASPTCGFVKGGGNQVSGFCCTCQDHKNNVQQRGGQRCDTPDKTPQLLTSAHCLRSSPHWYNVYELQPPHLYQKLRFEIFKSQELRNGSITWEKMSDSKQGVEVDSDNPVNASGSVKVSYRPHTEGISKSAIRLDPSSNRLFIPAPSPFIKSTEYPDPFKGTIEDQILIIPQKLMAPHGARCDLVGTRIKAFMDQDQPCRQEKNACLNNQPFDLWKRDEGPNGDPESKFQLKSFGQLDPNIPVTFAADYETGSLFMQHKAESPTYVDIEIPADGLIIQTPGYNAFIESVLTETGREGVKIVTTVLNKELVDANFLIDLVHCSENVSLKMVTPAEKIGPLNSFIFYQDLHPFKISQPMYCYVVLMNEYGESVAAREVTFFPSEVCVCLHTCKCTCGGKADLKCIRMSDENLIATGLAHEVKTLEQLTADEDTKFHRKTRRVFHVILIFCGFLLCLLCLGLLKALIGLMCCRNLALFGLDYFYDDKRKGGISSLTTGEIVSRNMNFFFCFPLILVRMGKRGNEKYAMSDEENEYDQGEGELGETDVDLINTSRGSEESDITLYNRHEQEPVKQTDGVSIEALAGSRLNVLAKQKEISSKVDTGRTKSWADMVNKMNKRSKPDTEQSATSSAPDIGTGPIGLQNTEKDGNDPKRQAPEQMATEKWKNYQKDPTKKREHKIHKMRSLAGPGSGISERSIFVKSDPSPIHLPGSGGPQAAASSDSQLNANASFMKFSQMISASSSKSSFGTWHRRRKEQFSAYDFLPESKYRGSF